MDPPHDPFERDTPKPPSLPDSHSGSFRNGAPATRVPAAVSQQSGPQQFQPAGTFTPSMYQTYTPQTAPYWQPANFTFPVQPPLTTQGYRPPVWLGNGTNPTVAPRTLPLPGPMHPQPLTRANTHHAQSINPSPAQGHVQHRQREYNFLQEDEIEMALGIGSSQRTASEVISIGTHGTSAAPRRLHPPHPPPASTSPAMNPPLPNGGDQRPSPLQTLGKGGGMQVPVSNFKTSTQRENYHRTHQLSPPQTMPPVPTKPLGEIKEPQTVPSTSPSVISRWPTPSSSTQQEINTSPKQSLDRQLRSAAEAHSAIAEPETAFQESAPEPKLSSISDTTPKASMNWKSASDVEESQEDEEEWNPVTTRRRGSTTATAPTAEGHQPEEKPAWLGLYPPSHDVSRFFYGLDGLCILPLALLQRLGPTHPSTFSGTYTYTPSWATGSPPRPIQPP